MNNLDYDSNVSAPSSWLNYIQRYLNVESRYLIDDNGVHGITSNPTIFEKAIIESHNYDSDIRAMSLKGLDPKEIYDSLSRRDVRIAADKERMTYDKSNGKEGYVCLEVNPHLAHDGKGTIEEARRLWDSIDRPNILIKIPATKEGLLAIKQLTSEGINLDITWLFGLDRYRQVAEAYIEGIKDRLDQGGDVKYVVSVASFFVSHIDWIVDDLLQKIVALGGNKRDLARQLLGQASVASAKIGYQIYKEIFTGPCFKKLIERGARTQGIAWTSTSSKHPDNSDHKFIEALIGPGPENTVPVDTLNIFHEHGVSKARLENNVEDAVKTLERLKELDINIDAITQQLEDEGVEKFKRLFDLLMQALGKT